MSYTDEIQTVYNLQHVGLQHCCRDQSVNRIWRTIATKRLRETEGDRYFIKNLEISIVRQEGSVDSNGMHTRISNYQGLPLEEHRMSSMLIERGCFLLLLLRAGVSSELLNQHTACTQPELLFPIYLIGFLARVIHVPIKMPRFCFSGASSGLMRFFKFD